MTIRLDHTIVPAKDKVASAEFFAEIFGLKVKLGPFRRSADQREPHLCFRGQTRSLGRTGSRSPDW